MKRIRMHWPLTPVSMQLNAMPDEMTRVTCDLWQMTKRRSHTIS